MEEQTRPFLLPVEVQLDGVDFFVLPGGNVEIQATVINHQQDEDIFELTLRGVPMDWVTVTPAITVVPSGQRVTMRLVIQPPAVAAASSGVYPVVVRAASQQNSGVSAEIEASLRVGAYETGSRIRILMDALQYVVIPGAGVTVPLILFNQGMSEDLLRLSIDGIPVSWVSTPTPVMRLQPGERREINLMIQPPRSPQARAGRTPFTIRVSSQQAPDQASSVDCILTLAVFSLFSSDLNPPRVEPGQPVRVRIFNQGNVQDTYTVRWQSQNEGVDFTTEMPTSVRVQPGEAAAVDFSASPQNKRLFGGTVILPYTVTVQSSEGEAQSHTGEMIDRAVLPLWVLPAFLVLCLGILCLTGLVWTRGRMQASSATLTITAQTATVLAASQTAEYNQTAAALNGQEDTDGDGLTNIQEQQLGTNPESADSDSDRLLDGDEIRLGANPLQPDTDGDGLLDGADLDPLDPANPKITATALASLPTAIPTGTPLPSSTPLPGATPAPSATQPEVSPTVEYTPTSSAPVLPSGSALVFESNRDGPSEIYRLIDGSEAVSRLTISPSVDTQPAWSPDGSRVVFTSNRDGNNEIYVMNADGTAVANLSNNPANDQYPAWSPDGSQIIFTTDRDGNQEIYLMQADGSNPQNLSNDPAQDFYPFWFQEQGVDRVVFTTGRDGNLEVYAMNPDGSNGVNLTNSPSNESFPAAPRNGGKIAFVSDRDGNADVYVMNSDGSDPVNRTNNPASDSYPAFTPDGSWLAFTTDRDGNQEIYIMQTDGADLGNISHNPAEDLFARWR